MKQTNQKTTDIESHITDSADALNAQLEKTLSALHQKKLKISPWKEYYYQRAMWQPSQKLLKSNDYYQNRNNIPPKPKAHKVDDKPLSDDETLNVLSHTHYRANLGKEDSVSQHQFNDYAPMAINVRTLQPLYTPKTVKYIYASINMPQERGLKVKADLQKYLDLNDHERAQHMQKIMTIRYITQKDTHDNACDVQLVSQKGAFAAIDIPQYTVIGVYAGIFLRNIDDMYHLSKRLCFKDCQDYLFRIPDNGQKFPRISAYKYGNRLSIINAATNYSHNDETNLAQLKKRENVFLISASTAETPQESYKETDTADMLFFVANQDISQGTQLLYDYSKSYW